MSRASFIRCFPLRGTGVLIGTLTLLCVTGWHGKGSTESEALQPSTVVTTTTVATTTATTTTQVTITEPTTENETTTAKVTELLPEATVEVTDVLLEATTESLTTDPLPETTTETPTIPAVVTPVTDYEYQLLCKIVCSEYGGMPDVCERSKIVASVMNQSARLGKSIEQCLYQTCVPWGFNINGEYFCGKHYTDMADAVDYYFANRDTVFADWDADSWYGSGYGTNIFHRQLY